ncbi:MAG: hypothetical protein EP319_03460 [Deltaproteobacteria bacterium]|nr:MAG: hypothetical protein EP319_03460 [Deltaproteobacteria bacterium]
MKTLKLLMVMTLVVGSLNVFAIDESPTDCADVDGTRVDTSAPAGSTTGTTGNNGGNVTNE